MPLPANITKVTVSHKHTAIGGAAMAGTVTWALPIDLVDASAVTSINASSITTNLDLTGAWSVVLPVVDDPDAQPTGWTYTVTFTLSDPSGQTRVSTYHVQLTSAMAPTVDWSTLTQLSPVGEVSPYARLATDNVFTGTITVKGGKVTPIDWFNVKEYGAKGDGSTDDTAAIQAAINAVPFPGGVVYIPAGQYKISAAITVRSRLRLVGDGDASSIVSQTNTSADGFTGVDIDRLTFTGLKILGPGSGTGTGINLTRSARAATTYTTITDVHVISFGKDGIAISNAIVSRFERIISEANGNHGFNLYGVNGGAAGTSCALIACYGNANTQAGIRLFNMVYCALSACAGDDNGIAYLIDSCQGITIDGSGAESQNNNSPSYPGTSLKVVNSIGVDIGAFWVYLNPQIGIYITGNSRDVSLTNCVDNTPDVGAVSFIKVDAGCGVVMTACSNTTANSIAGGTTQFLDDGGGGMVIRAYLYAEQDITSVGGNLITSLPGTGVRVKEGTAAKMGTATLTAGTVTVTNTSVTANSRIFLTAQAVGGTAGALRVDSRVPAASFTVKSTSATDTSTFAYFIVEPS